MWLSTYLRIWRMEAATSGSGSLHPSESFFCVSLTSSLEHILFLSSKVPGGARLTPTATGQRATAGAVSPNPVSDAAVLLAPPPRSGPQLESRRAVVVRRHVCSRRPPICHLRTVSLGLPAAALEFVACASMVPQLVCMF
jgi:hypothetical protein